MTGSESQLVSTLGWHKNGASNMMLQDAFKQYRMAAFLGMNIEDTALTKQQMGRIIGQLKDGMPLKEVARINGIHDRNWGPVGPSLKQKRALRGIHANWITTEADASMVISAKKNQAEFFTEMHATIASCDSNKALTKVARDISHVGEVIKLDGDEYAQLVESGRSRRADFTPTEF